MAVFKDYPLNLEVAPGRAIRRNVADTEFETFDTTAPGGNPDWDDVQNKPATFPPATHNHDAAYAPIAHNHDAAYEAKNTNIQAHISSTHAPSDAQKNSDITEAEIEAKLTGEISSHTHAGGGASDIALSMLAPANDETITANCSAVVVRRYAVASTKKLTIGLGSRFRIL